MAARLANSSCESTAHQSSAHGGRVKGRGNGAGGLWCPQLTFSPLALRILAAAAASIFPLDMVVMKRDGVGAGSKREGSKEMLLSTGAADPCIPSYQTQQQTQGCRI